MLSYAETDIFTPEQVLTHHRAQVLVETLPEDPFGPERLRCHELARAVGVFLDLPFHDGRLGGVEHSWLTIGPVSDTGAIILDVYMPGALPQVQLVDNRRPGLIYNRSYEKGPPRKDIDVDQVKALVWAFKEIQAVAESEGLWP